MNKPVLSYQARAAYYSSGLVLGRAHCLGDSSIHYEKQLLQRKDLAHEEQRLKLAVQQSEAALQASMAAVSHTASKDARHILEAHCMLLSDPALLQGVLALIDEQQVNAEWALQQYIQGLCVLFSRAEDAYLRSKQADIRHVGNRIMRCLQSLREHVAEGDLHQEILIARDLCPVDIVQAWRRGVAGLVLEDGAAHAHALIVARGLNLPTLCAAKGVLAHVYTGNVFLLDADKGYWQVNPSCDEQATFAQRVQQQKMAQVSQSNIEPHTEMVAGKPLALQANIEFVEEVALAKRVGVSGIGLYRTEFCFMGLPEAPCEDQQYDVYRQVVRLMDGQPVTFRLLDAGADKNLPFLCSDVTAEHEANPALGLRGIRLLLKFPDLLRTQLSALLRASEHGPIRILVPMVTTLEELLAVREHLQACAQRLGIESIPELGAMIEVPAAVWIADELAQVSDFFSIGTNDLFQYSLAVDRNNEAVSSLYSVLHPAMQAMLQHIVDMAQQHGLSVSLCGEMAADAACVDLIASLGFDALSMSPSMVPMVRASLQD